MSWKLTVTLFVVNVGISWCLTELQEKCITEFAGDLDNDFFLGTWYRVIYFTYMGNSLPTPECPIFTYEKPNSTDLKRYTDEYSKPNAPFSTNDNPIHEDGGYYHPRGYLVGNKEAKFYIMDPDTCYYRPPYDVMIFQRLNNEFVLFHECKSRLHWAWLMSRQRNPSSEKVEAAINSHPELLDLGRQWFCVRDKYEKYFNQKYNF